jgi:hypothetical protein
MPRESDGAGGKGGSQKLFPQKAGQEITGQERCFGSENNQV